MISIDFELKDYMMMFMVFLAGLISDIFWTIYVFYATKKNKNSRKLAAHFSVGIGICTLLMVYVSLHNIVFSFFWLIGLWIGTYQALWIKENFLNKLLKKRKLIKIPVIRQSFEYSCGAKVTQGILNFFNIDVREDVLIEKCKTNQTNGTNMFNIVSVINEYGIKCFAKETNIEEIKKSIDKKLPVIVCFQAWANLENYKTSWENGHYSIIIGYDKKNFYFRDPASFNICFLSFKDFESRWHDKDENQTYKNFAIFIKKSNLKNYNAKNLLKIE
jgi:predicted double-glycine peptidase